MEALEHVICTEAAGLGCRGGGRRSHHLAKHKVRGWGLTNKLPVCVCVCVCVCM